MIRNAYIVLRPVRSVLVRYVHPLNQRRNSCNQSKQTSLEPTSKISELPNVVQKLEQTSLVGFGSKEAVVRLEEAVNFAAKLYEVNTDAVEPMYTVLENESLYLRPDEAVPTNLEDILCNAAVTEEGYFVSPPGNIPLDTSNLASDSSEQKAKASNT